MQSNSALAMLAAFMVLQCGTAAAAEKPSVSPTAQKSCRDAITPSVQPGAGNLGTLEKKEMEARLREIARRISADPRVRQQLGCLMKSS